MFLHKMDLLKKYDGHIYLTIESAVKKNSEKLKKIEEI